MNWSLCAKSLSNFISRHSKIRARFCWINRLNVNSVAIFTQQKFHHRQLFAFVWVRMCLSTQSISWTFLFWLLGSGFLFFFIRLKKKENRMICRKILLCKCQSVKQWDPLMSRCWCMANSILTKTTTQIMATLQVFSMLFILCAMFFCSMW